MAGPTSANYDVTLDGERFLMIEAASPIADLLPVNKKRY
jgi:hypothetical protein